MQKLSDKVSLPTNVGAAKYFLNLDRAGQTHGIVLLFLATEKIYRSRVDLAQLVRFLVVKLTHPGLNPRFDMSVAFTANYSFSGRRRLRRQGDALGDRLRESQDQTGSVFQKCS